MGQFSEYIKMAIDNIRANKGRSFLTMLGIIIGIASVITVVSVGMGVKNDVQKTTSGGQQMMTINATQEDTPKEIITSEDIKAVKDALGNRIKGATVSGSTQGTITTGKGSFESMITLTTPDAEHNPYTSDLTRGKFFTDDDLDNGSMVCVIDKLSAITLFGTSDVVGMDFELTVDNSIQTVTVVGVTNMTDEEIASYKESNEMFGMKQTISLTMPYTTSVAFGNAIERFSSVSLYPTDVEDANAISKIAIRMLSSRHLNDSDSVFQKQKEMDFSEIMGNALNAVTAFVALVASISLLVGGIGVMNIMLVSVTERTREIGIRKALGARTVSIITQFLFESAIISGLGGVIGILLGVGISALISAISTSMNTMITWQVIVIATAFSCGVGVIFGIYPAQKAAKMSPIEALRQM